MRILPAATARNARSTHILAAFWPDAQSCASCPTLSIYTPGHALGPSCEVHYTIALISTRPNIKSNTQLFCFLFASSPQCQCPGPSTFAAVFFARIIISYKSTSTAHMYFSFYGEMICLNFSSGPSSRLVHGAKDKWLQRPLETNLYRPLLQLQTHQAPIIICSSEGNNKFWIKILKSFPWWIRVQW